MPGFRRGDVVKVPFAYTDRPTRQYRPALVVAAGDLEDTHGCASKLKIPEPLTPNLTQLLGDFHVVRGLDTLRHRLIVHVLTRARSPPPDIA